ncbi:hypothetical protein [Rhizobiales bacterium 3FA27D7]|jgi:hypothetical protein|uniref:hypothetical protein n=1 Tax=Mesorhizobium sp. 2RAF21 TaxID=3232995 RepID=UPI0010F7D3BC
MTDSSAPPVPRHTAVLTGNVGEPIKLTELMLNGVTAEAAREGQTSKSGHGFISRLTTSLFTGSWRA